MPKINLTIECENSEEAARILGLVATPKKKKKAWTSPPTVRGEVRGAVRDDDAVVESSYSQLDFKHEDLHAPKNLRQVVGHLKAHGYSDVDKCIAKAIHIAPEVPFLRRFNNIERSVREAWKAGNF